MWKKRIVALSLFISLFYLFCGPFFGLSLFYLGQCSINDDHHTSIYLQLNDHVNYMIMQSNMTMMQRVIINGTVVSCMAIYLGMAMEMP